MPLVVVLGLQCCLLPGLGHLQMPLVVALGLQCWLLLGLGLGHLQLGLRRLLLGLRCFLTLGMGHLLLGLGRLLVGVLRGLGRRGFALRSLRWHPNQHGRGTGCVLHTSEASHALTHVQFV